jgi:hypothetical protein
MTKSREITLLTAEQLADRCGVAVTFIHVLVEHGVIHLQRREPPLFHHEVTLRINKVVRLQRDLEVNVPGASVILELLERIEQLERLTSGRR